MAWKTLDEEIADLEAELATVKTQIANLGIVKELEEGGGNARFRTDFVSNTSLYKREKEINTRLTTLRMGAR